jgi:hypothetical protein
LVVTAVVPASDPSNAATTPAMDRATRSPPMTHIQMGILRVWVDFEAVGRLAECTVSSESTLSSTGGGGVTPTGRRRAVQARPFQ